MLPCFQRLSTPRICNTSVRSPDDSSLNRLINLTMDSASAQAEYRVNETGYRPIGYLSPGCPLPITLFLRADGLDFPFTAHARCPDAWSPSRFMFIHFLLYFTRNTTRPSSLRVLFPLLYTPRLNKSPIPQRLYLMHSASIQ